MDAYEQARVAFKKGIELSSQILEPPQEVDLNNIKLPYILQNRVLMVPGMWNGDYYDAAEIKRAFETTDWSDPENTALVLDHENEDVAHWIGSVVNPRMLGEKLIGDIHIVDENTAKKVLYSEKFGNAKFGVSPRIKGIVGLDHAVKQMKFNNFAVVFKPAQGEYTHLKSRHLFYDIDVPKVTLILQQKPEVKPMNNLNTDMNSCVASLQQAGYSPEQSQVMCQAGMNMAAQPAPAAPPTQPNSQLSKDIDALKEEVKRLSALKDSVKEVLELAKKNDSEFLGRKTLPSGGAPATPSYETVIKELAANKDKFRNNKMASISEADTFKKGLIELRKATTQESRNQFFLNHLKSQRGNRRE